MFARVTTFEGSPDRIEEGIRIFRENVIPWLREATGFRGWIVLLDRSAGKSISLTLWATEEAMDSEQSGGRLRDEVAASVGATMRTLERYEVAVVESLALEETS